MEPKYSKDEFIEACQKKEVFVDQSALDDARKHFNLPSKGELLKFIGDGLCKDLTFINSLPYRNWKGKVPAPLVDAYRFFTIDICGYLAFFQGPSKKWNLKSFHPDDNGDPRGFLLADKLKEKLKQLEDKGLLPSFKDKSNG